ncbi:hypothetical protein [Candidatus Berkiella aquae]|uniref:Uncharacterized protein n=1 Tax=Candidatus Berkiella aquae TaxID=295108 RepID=A0A0Q9YXX5_9GAMM|nr:hypothetical protein [Candidatus Berkiella aquae]MCS5711521.1 hypothetical protein [Candidatus Berkiella aquae]
MSLSFSTEDLAELDKLRQFEDYKEGAHVTDDSIAYLGSTSNKRKTKTHLRDEQVIQYYRERPEFYGKVLNPEGRNDNWTYEKNQAFMLGAIEAKKTFILITPRSEYDHSYVTTTIDELLWLKDNGYTFSKGKEDTLICTPSSAEATNPIIRNYYNGTSKYSKEQMNNDRNEVFGFKSKTYTPSFSSSGSKQYSNPKKYSTNNDGWTQVGNKQKSSSFTVK